MSEDEPNLTIGTAVYDVDGNQLGTVRGFDTTGFFVSSTLDLPDISMEHEHSVPIDGEGFLMWRCTECGEMGDIDEMPDTCPACGAAREHLYYWTED